MQTRKDHPSNHTQTIIYEILVGMSIDFMDVCEQEGVGYENSDVGRLYADDSGAGKCAVRVPER